VRFINLRLLSALVCVAGALPGAAPLDITRDWLVIFRENLHNTLQFWIDHSVDREYGGLLGRLDQQGNAKPPGNKSVVLESRALWSFAEAYRRFPDPAYQRMAAECLTFLREKMWDKEHGGYYFLVTREGKVLDSTKQLNPLSYVLEGLAEYAIAFHDDQARREAVQLFEVIDQHAHDNEHGGYHIAFTADWQWIKDYKPGPNASGSFGRKSYDWHLGLLEALTTAYDVTGDARIRARVDELLDIFVNKIVDPEIGYGRYYFTEDWTVADRNGDSRECEYGLDLEASWLLTEAASVVGRNQDPKIRRASLALVDHALRYGFDNERGGLYRTGPAKGPATNRDMEWWQQAETLVAFLNAYQLTGDPKYFTAFELEAQFVDNHFVDHTYGEWYTAISHDGKTDTEKTGPWKAPYHVTRACLEVISRLGRTL